MIQGGTVVKAKGKHFFVIFRIQGRELGMQTQARTLGACYVAMHLARQKHNNPNFFAIAKLPLRTSGATFATWIGLIK